MAPGPASGGNITADLVVGYMEELLPLMILHDQNEHDPSTSKPETLSLPALRHVPTLDGEPSLAPTLELASTALALFGPDVMEAADGEEVRENLDRHHEVLNAFQALLCDDDVRIVVVPAREVYRE